MPDILISLIVVVCTGAVLAVIFILTRKKTEAREQALKLYCQKNGFGYEKQKNGLNKTTIIKGANWEMSSEMIAVKNSSQGSTEWIRHSVFESKSPDNNRRVFILGSVSATDDWDSIPVWMQGLAVEKLGLELGFDIRDYKARTLVKKGQTAYLLFEQDDGGPVEEMGDIETLLEDWPQDIPVVILRDTHGVIIKVMDNCIDDAEGVDRLVWLGKTCEG